VAFSWIDYKLRKQRDRINAAAMSRPAPENAEKAMSFNSMFLGGFQVLLATDLEPVSGQGRGKHRLALALQLRFPIVSSLGVGLMCASPE
jgi:hypothetical protein